MATTLVDFLSPLKTLNVQVVIKDLAQENICKIYSDTITTLDTKISSRTVNRWDIIRNNLLYVYLNDEEEIINVPVEGVSLNFDTLSMNVGDSETLVAIISPSNATNQNVSWISSDENIATVTDGVITAISEGNASVSVVTDDGSFIAICLLSISVPTIAVESVELNQYDLQIVLENTDFPTLEATVYPDNASYDEIIWTSSDETVVTVENGVLTPISVGTSNVIASVNGVESAPCSITVINEG